MALLVGVTGGMGSGKTTVSGILSREGGQIIDADQICRQLVEPDKPAWEEVVNLFGSDILLSDKTLDRKKIADIIFKDQVKKKELETILHPRVFEEEQRVFGAFKKENPDIVVILDAALLIESGNYRKVDKVVVVGCSQNQQIDRIVAKGKFSAEDALRRISQQMSLEDKKAVADFVLENDSTLEELDQKVVLLYKNLKALA